MRTFVFALVVGMGASVAQKPSVSVEMPRPEVRYLEWGAYGAWALGMASIFTGYVYDGKGADARIEAQRMYDGAVAGQALDVDRYHALRSDVSSYRQSRNMWFGLGLGLLVSSGATYGYSVYLDKKTRVVLKPDGAQFVLSFGGL